MRVTVDRKGRIVIPRRLRDALGIGPGSACEVYPVGSGLRLVQVRPSERVVAESDGLPLLDVVPGAVLRDADVVRLRDDAATVMADRRL